ncbi:hypothetical protein PR048_023009 [Dryococelus australis]|uniref:Uncharacterized protein n=1 Tax=Dryococelus australis TaxID=614101 RepID=A0ABQ9GSV5_9NEOP|nr:hypothetical protein PR048_023009 [Dryococelus australis]
MTSHPLKHRVTGKLTIWLGSMAGRAAQYNDTSTATSDAAILLGFYSIVPATSLPAEEMFSASGNIISGRRTCLSLERRGRQSVVVGSTVEGVKRERERDREGVGDPAGCGRYTGLGEEVGAERGVEAGVTWSPRRPQLPRMPKLTYSSHQSITSSVLRQHIGYTTFDCVDLAQRWHSSFISSCNTRPAPLLYTHFAVFLQGVVWLETSSLEGRGSYEVRLLASHLGESGSIPGGVVPGFSHMVLVPEYAAGRRVFSGISHFTHPFIPALLHSHLASPSSALKTSVKSHRNLSTPFYSSQNKPGVNYAKLRIFPSIWESTGRCRWSAGFLGDLQFPPLSVLALLHAHLALPSLALKPSMLTAAQNPQSYLASGKQTPELKRRTFAGASFFLRNCRHGIFFPVTLDLGPRPRSPSGPAGGFASHPAPVASAFDEQPEEKLSSSPVAPTRQALRRTLKRSSMFTLIATKQTPRYVLTCVGSGLLKTEKHWSQNIKPQFLQGPRGEVFARGNRAGRCTWSAGFLEALPFPPTLHSSLAPYSPRLTLIGSQDLGVKSHPNLFIHSLGDNEVIRDGEKVVHISNEWETNWPQETDVRMAVPGFEPGSSRIRAHGFITVPPRSALETVLLAPQFRKRGAAGEGRVSCARSLPQPDAVLKTFIFVLSVALADARQISYTAGPSLLPDAASSRPKRSNLGLRAASTRGSNSISISAIPSLIVWNGLESVKLMETHVQLAVVDVVGGEFCVVTGPAASPRCQQQLQHEDQHVVPPHLQHIATSSVAYHIHVIHYIMFLIFTLAQRSAVVQWLDYSPPDKANRARFPAGLPPDFRMWESCRTMPLVGGFSRDLPLPLAFAFRRCSIHLASPSSALKSPLVRTAQISSPTTFARDYGFLMQQNCRREAHQ